MKKRLLSVMLSFSMVFSTLPMSAFATGLDSSSSDEDAAPVCICESRCVEGEENTECPVCSVDASACKCTATEDDESSSVCSVTEGCTLPERHEGDCSVENDTEEVSATDAIQFRIDALPNIDALKGMNDEKRDMVYREICDIYDAIDKLTEGANNLDTAKLDVSLKWFKQQEMSLEDAQENPPTAYLEGDGTKEQPFEIYTAEDFYAINAIEKNNKNNVTYYYKQMNDIDFSQATANFDYCYVNTTFRGVYDGGNYKMKSVDRPLFYKVVGSRLDDSESSFANYTTGGDYLSLYSAAIMNVTVVDVAMEYPIPTSYGKYTATIAVETCNATLYHCKVQGGSIKAAYGGAGITGCAASTIFDSCVVEDVSIRTTGSGVGITLHFFGEGENQNVKGDGPSVMINCQVNADIYSSSGQKSPFVVYIGSNKCGLYFKDLTAENVKLSGSGGHFGGVIADFSKMGMFKVVLENIYVSGSVTAGYNSYVGGVFGTNIPYNLEMNNVNVDKLKLPDNDPKNLCYVGTFVGINADKNSSIDAENGKLISDKDGLGKCGKLTSARLKNVTGDLVFNGSVSLIIEESCDIDSITTTAGAVTIVSNAGKIGTITSAGKVVIGVENSGEDEGTYHYPKANTGEIGNIKARDSVSVYRNTGTIGNITGTSVAVGQVNDKYKDYQVNTGTIGDIKATTDTVNIISNQGSIGSITAEKNAVTIGFLNKPDYGNTGIVGDISASTSIALYYNSGTVGNISSKLKGITVYATAGKIGNIDAATSVVIGYYDKNNPCAINGAEIGSVAAGTMVTIYNATSGKIGDVTAGNSITVSVNQGSIGNLEGTSVTIGRSGTNADYVINGVSYVSGNAGVIGNIKTTSASVIIYKNQSIFNEGTRVANTGIIGNVEAIGNIAIGQSDARYHPYQNNSGIIGGLNAVGTISIFADSADGKIACGNGEKVEARLGVTIGSTTVTNGNQIGDILNKTSGDFRVHNGENGKIKSCTINYNGGITVGTSTVPNKGTIGSITALLGTVSGYTETAIPVNAKINRLQMRAASVGTVNVHVTIVKEGEDTIVTNTKTGEELYRNITTLQTTAGITVTVEEGVSFDKILAKEALTVKNYGKVNCIEGNGYNSITVNFQGMNSSVGNILNGAGSITITAGTAGRTEPIITGAITAKGKLDFTKTGSGSFGTTNPIPVKAIGSAVSIGAGAVVCTIQLTADSNLESTLLLRSESNNVYTNTIDLTKANLTGVSVVDSTSAFTTVSYPNGAGADSGTEVITTDKFTISSNKDKVILSTNITAITIAKGVTVDELVCENVGNLTITNQGTIRKITGKKSVTTKIDNSENGQIGEISAAGDINILNNESKIGNIQAAGLITIGEKDAVATKPRGNQLGAAIGNITSTDLTVTIYRNAGTIGNVTAKTGITIGQNTKEYNCNSGKIGSLNCSDGYLVVYNNTATGELAVGDGETIEIGLDKITIGTEGIPNKGKVGNIVSTSAGSHPINIYSQGSVGNITAENNKATVTYFGLDTKSQIGAIVNKKGAVTIGASSKTNKGSVESIEAGGIVTVYNSMDGKVGNIQGADITIGSIQYLNEGTIGDINATSTVNVYSSGTIGNIKQLSSTTPIVIYAPRGTIGTVTNRFGVITIGNSSNADLVNGATIGEVSGASVTIYNKNGEIADCEATNGDVWVYTNGKGGTLGNLTASKNLRIGDPKATTDNKYYGVVGNAGTIGNMKGGFAAVYRNEGTIGTIESTISSISIGGSASYNFNAGVIGSLDSATSISICSQSISGKIATAAGEKIKAGTSVAIGNENAKNENAIGDVEAETTISVYDNGGSYKQLLAKGSATSTIRLYNADAKVTMECTNGGLSIYNMCAGTPTVNATALGDVNNTKYTDKGNGKDYWAIANLTSKASENRDVLISGKFANLIIAGDGNVIARDDTTVVGNLIVTPGCKGTYMIQGDVGNVVNPNEKYSFSIIQGVGANKNKVDIYVVGYPNAPKGTVKLSINGTEETIDNSISGPADSLVRHLKTVTYNAVGTNTLNIQGTIGDGENKAKIQSLNTTIEVPRLFDKTLMMFLANKEEYEAMKKQYGWADSPTYTFPVVAFVPTINSSFANEDVVIKKANGQETGAVFVEVARKNVKVGETIDSGTLTAELTNYFSDTTTLSYTFTSEDAAKVSDDSCIITYKYMDAITADKEVVGEKEAAMTLETPVRAGYTFLGWKAAGDNTVYDAGSKYVPTDDVTFIATWIANAKMSTVNVVKPIGGSIYGTVSGTEIEMNGTYSFITGTDLVLTSKPLSNYVFDKWLINGVSYTTNNIKITVDKDTTIQAVFTRKSSHDDSSYTYYTITASAGVGGTISTGERVLVRAGDSAGFTMTPDKGYMIADVRVDGKSVGVVTNYVFTNVRANHTIEVLFKVSSGHGNLQTGVAFEDVSENDWFYNAVYTAVKKGWFAGISDTTFAPNRSTTRGMIVTVLWRMENKPTAAIASIFEDVASGAYYADGVAWAQKNGIVNGYGNGKFGPQNHITREQLAAILYRYAQFKGYDVTKTISLDSFTDSSAVSAFAIKPMKWAVANGIIKGKSNGILDSKGKATRAEVATILTRFDEFFSAE